MENKYANEYTDKMVKELHAMVVDAQIATRTAKGTEF